MADTAALSAEIRALSQMRVAGPGPEGVPVVLDCAATWATPPKQFEAARRLADLPQELVDFWSVTHELLLFYDVLHGQYGLRLVGPQEAAKATVELAEEWREAD